MEEGATGAAAASPPRRCSASSTTGSPPQLQRAEHHGPVVHPRVTSSPPGHQAATAAVSQPPLQPPPVQPPPVQPPPLQQPSLQQPSLQQAPVAQQPALSSVKTTRLPRLQGIVRRIGTSIAQSVIGGGTTDTKTGKKDFLKAYLKKFDADEVEVLRKVYRELSFRGGCKGINKETFLEYFPLPGLWGERLFQRFDYKCLGFVDYEEFLVGIAVCCRGTKCERIHALFQVFDLNGDGVLQRQELVAMLSNLPHLDRYVIMNASQKKSGPPPPFSEEQLGKQLPRNISAQPFKSPSQAAALEVIDPLVAPPAMRTSSGGAHQSSPFRQNSGTSNASGRPLDPVTEEGSVPNSGRLESGPSCINSPMNGGVDVFDHAKYSSRRCDLFKTDSVLETGNKTREQGDERTQQDQPESMRKPYFGSRTSSGLLLDGEDEDDLLEDDAETDEDDIDDESNESMGPEALNLIPDEGNSHILTSNSSLSDHEFLGQYYSTNPPECDPSGVGFPVPVGSSQRGPGLSSDASLGAPFVSLGTRPVSHGTGSKSGLKPVPENPSSTGDLGDGGKKDLDTQAFDVEAFVDRILEECEFSESDSLTFVEFKTWLEKNDGILKMFTDCLHEEAWGLQGNALFRRTAAVVPDSTRSKLGDRNRRLFSVNPGNLVSGTSGLFVFRRGGGGVLEIRPDAFYKVQRLFSVPNGPSLLLTPEKDLNISTDTLDAGKPGKNTTSDSSCMGDQLSLKGTTATHQAQLQETVGNPPSGDILLGDSSVAVGSTAVNTDGLIDGDELYARRTREALNNELLSVVRASNPGVDINPYLYHGFGGVISRVKRPPRKLSAASKTAGNNSAMDKSPSNTLTAVGNRSKDETTLTATPSAFKNSRLPQNGANGRGGDVLSPTEGGAVMSSGGVGHSRINEARAEIHSGAESSAVPGTVRKETRSSHGGMTTGPEDAEQSRSSVPSSSVISQQPLSSGSSVMNLIACPNCKSLLVVCPRCQQRKCPAVKLQNGSVIVRCANCRDNRPHDFERCWHCDWLFNEAAEMVDKCEPLLEGQLFKIGRHTRKWRGRYFVLVDNLLYYYGKKEDSRPKGFIFLEGCFVEPIVNKANNVSSTVTAPVNSATLAGGASGAAPFTASSAGADSGVRVGGTSKYGFSITHGAGKLPRRDLYASTDAERSAWIDALRVATNQQSVESKYAVGAQIGQGKFSVVYKAVHRETGEEFAIKVIDKSKITGHDRELLRSELAILRLLRHKHVILFKEIVDSRKAIHIVMELVRGGELYDLVQQRRRLPELQVNRIINQLLNTVAYLHKCGIIHRDIKPENILLTEKNAEDADVKLTDFGLSCICGIDEFVTQPCGTLAYVAPEVLTLRGYNHKVDVWSVGVVMYLLLRGRLPFPVTRRPNGGTLLPPVPELKFDGSIWAGISSSSKDLLRKMLQPNPDNRISAKDALEHLWIKNPTAVISEPALVPDPMHENHAAEAASTEPGDSVPGPKDGGESIGATFGPLKRKSSLATHVEPPVAGSSNFSKSTLFKSAADKDSKDFTTTDIDVVGRRNADAVLDVSASTFAVPAPPQPTVIPAAVVSHITGSQIPPIKATTTLPVVNVAPISTTEAVSGPDKRALSAAGAKNNIDSCQTAPISTKSESASAVSVTGTMKGLGEKSGNINVLPPSSGTNSSATISVPGNAVVAGEVVAPVRSSLPALTAKNLTAPITNNPEATTLPDGSSTAAPTSSTAEGHNISTAVTTDPSPQPSLPISQPLHQQRDTGVAQSVQAEL